MKRMSNNPGTPPKDAERKYLTQPDEDALKNVLDLMDTIFDDGEYKVNLSDKVYDEIFELNQDTYE